MGDGLVYFNIEYLFYAVYSLFAGTPDDGVTVEINTPAPEKVVEVSGVSPDAVTLWDIFTITMIVVSLILAVGIVYAVIRMSQIRHRSRQAHEIHRRSSVSSPISRTTTHTTPEDTGIQNRWITIQAGATSPDPRSWRNALEKADALLKENPKTSTLSREELAPVETWRVYTKEGSDEILTQARTQEALAKYEALFRRIGLL